LDFIENNRIRVAYLPFNKQNLIKYGKKFEKHSLRTTNASLMNHMLKDSGSKYESNGKEDMFDEY